MLTCALEKRKHSGRVRGVGAYVTPSMYFRLPKERRRCCVKNDQVPSLIEANNLISELNEVIAELFARLKKVEVATQKDKDIEEKGSCSVKQPCRLMDQEMDDDGKEDNDLMVLQKVDVMHVI